MAFLAMNDAAVADRPGHECIEVDAANPAAITRRLPEFDVLRGAAIIFVVYLHAYFSPWDVTPRRELFAMHLIHLVGHTAVPVFFFVSAFLLARDTTPTFREFGIPYRDGGSSLQLITHCPWCGVRLPLSLRGKWFGELESLGYKPDLFDASNVPTKYLTDEWWKQS